MEEQAKKIMERAVKQEQEFGEYFTGECVTILLLHLPGDVGRPLPRNGGMADDHGSPEARRLPTS